MMSNFDTAIQLVLNHEGSVYTNDPTDRGGPTKYGITIPDLPKGATATDIMNLTEDKAKAVYKAKYWDAMNLDRITDPRLAAVILDQGVLRGMGHVHGVLIGMLGLASDLSWGALNMSVNARPATNVILNILNGEVVGYVDIVKSNPSQIKFLRGWENRVISLYNFAFRVTS